MRSQHKLTFTATKRPAPSEGLRGRSSQQQSSPRDKQRQMWICLVMMKTLQRNSQVQSKCFLIFMTVHISNDPYTIIKAYHG